MSWEKQLFVAVGLVAWGALVPGVAFAQQADPGNIIIPATSYTAEGGGKVGKRKPRTSRGYTHFWYTKGHWLEWTVDNARAGRYSLTIRYGTRFNPRREVKINGKVVRGLESCEFLSTDAWGKGLKDVTLPAKLPLKSGRNVLRVTCLDETSICLSDMKLSAPGRKDIVINSGRFTGQGGGKVQVIVPDPHGSFYQWDNKGHWLEWTIESASSGQYAIYLHYSTMDKAVRDLYVNGQMALKAFPLEPTGGWKFWVEERLPAGITLKRGRNVLRMINVEESLNLTAIRLVRSGKAKR